jgi:lysophospholipase L1-like esterase
MGKLGAAYLVSVHLALLAVVIHDDIPARAAARLGLMDRDLPEIAALRVAHAKLDASVPPGATLFLGDSHTQFMPVSAVAALAVNYGIARQRSDQLLRSVETYRAASTARAVVVLIGSNDVAQGREAGIGDRYRAILGKIAPGIPVFLVSLPPAQDEAAAARVLAVNAIARAACKQDRRCTFVDAWAALTHNDRPIAGVLGQDGSHLSPAGYARLISALRAALSHGTTPEVP